MIRTLIATILMVYLIGCISTTPSTTPHTAPIIRKQIRCITKSVDITTPWTYYVPIYSKEGRPVYFRIPEPTINTNRPILMAD